MRRSVRQSILMSMTGIMVIAGAASAGAPRTHDGFLLRLSAGFGSAKTSEDVETSSLEISGAAGDVNIAIGGVISPNLAIHGTLLGWSLADPTVELTGFGSGELDGDLTMTAVGVGLTYYFMPANFYVSPSIGAATITLDVPGSDDLETDTGVALEFTVGKEWWVGDSWGLGVAGSAGYHSIPDKDVDENLSGGNVAIRFTATLN
jgi:hypothetical protein